MQFLLLSRAASTRRISELPCRLSGTKNHHFAKLRFHDFQRLLQREPVSAKELARVKAQVMASSVYEQDSLFYQAMKLGMAETVGLGWQKSEQFRDKINQVTAEQVRRVADKYLVESQLSIAYLEPQTMLANTKSGVHHAH